MLNEYGSARYDAAAQLCACVYAKETGDNTFVDWAEGQMEYIMGKNPMNRPYIVGYSPTAASHPHHRAAHGSKTLNMDDPQTQTHVLWGALVGGPDASDWHRDITKDYIYNEVAVDYNAAFVGACAGLYNFCGTEDMKPQSNFPPSEASMKGDIVEYKLKASIGQEDNMATQVLVEIDNSSFLPPHYLKEAKVRYYFSIAELLKNGQTLDDLTVRVDYDAMKSNTDGKHEVTYNVVQYNDKGDCYIELTWTGYEFYGTMQFQFALMAQVQNEEYTFIWDPTNDYSRSGLSTCDELGVTLAEALTEYDLITMYVDGEHVWGKAPADAQEDETLYGDVDCNGAVEIADVVLLSRYVAQDKDAKAVTAQGLLNADCVKDGNVDMEDITAIARYLAHLIEASQLGKAS